jgi:alpha-tubulin suppressor-like RCC1 family protein
MKIHIVGEGMSKRKINLNKKNKINFFFSFGQIGDGTTTNRLLPVAVNNTEILNGKNILEICVGVYHTCAIANDGKAYCWGNNE